MAKAAPLGLAPFFPFLFRDNWECIASSDGFGLEKSTWLGFSLPVLWSDLIPNSLPFWP